MDYPKFGSYHVHTRWSDGENSVAEMILAAERQGLPELGITDHLVLHPQRATTIHWTIPQARLADYVEEVREKAAASSITIKLGLEVDYFPETIQEARESIAAHSFDYLIGSVHFVDGFSVDESASLWQDLPPSQIETVFRGYWRRIAEMAETGLFDLVGHADLPKKFGFAPAVGLDEEIGAALDAIARNGLTVELNTSGWNKPCEEAYPAQGILTSCARRGIPILVTADAHRDAELTQHFDRALAVLNRLGVAPVSQWSGKGR